MANLTAAAGTGWPRFWEEEDSYYTSTSCLCDLQQGFKVPPLLQPRGRGHAPQLPDHEGWAGPASILREAALYPCLGM